MDLTPITPNFIESRYGYATVAGAQFALLAWAMRDYRGHGKATDRSTALK